MRDARPAGWASVQQGDWGARMPAPPRQGFGLCFKVEVRVYIRGNTMRAMGPRDSGGTRDVLGGRGVDGNRVLGF